MSDHPQAMAKPVSRCRRPVFCFALFFFLLPIGCTSFQHSLDLAYQDARARNYERALAGLERSSLARSKNNRLLYLMEKGVLLHLAEQYRESNQVLEEADRLLEELFSRSISAESLSFLSSDNLVPFVGEDYESVYIHYYKLRNYLALAELEGARVESRKIDEKLNLFASRHQGRRAFRESGFLRLLTGLVYESIGDWNDAYIAYRKSLNTYREDESRYGVKVPEALWSRLLLAARNTGFQEEYSGHLAEARAAGIHPEVGEGVIAVLIDHGFIPVKREVFVIVPTEQGFPVKLALPEFQSRSFSGHLRELEVSITGAEWFRAERVEDVGAVARHSLEDRKNRVITKMIARAVAKELAARKAEREFGPGAGLLARIGGLATENADVRSWTMLPEQVLLAVIPAGAEEQEVRIRQGDRMESHRVVLDDRPVGFVISGR